jgi:hypothetical protein
MQFLDRTPLLKHQNQFYGSTRTATNGTIRSSSMALGRTMVSAVLELVPMLFMCTGFWLSMVVLDCWSKEVLLLVLCTKVQFKPIALKHA